jgi:hypothetical protein
MTDEDTIEQQIQDSGLTAPRITPEDIDATIKSSAYYIFPRSMLTVCCLTLQNDYYVVGESACVSTENFDAEIGRRVAYGKARDKIWALEGYLLKQKQYLGLLP